MFKFVTFTLLVFSVSGAPSYQQYGEQTNTNSVHFYLYTREVPHEQEIFLNDGQVSLYNSSYNPKAETKILIHDHNSTGEMVIEMVSAYIRDYQKYVNVLVVKSEHFSQDSYEEFLKIYKKIGESVADMVRYLHKIGAHPDNMHIVGHGFGAHIAAAAAASLLPLSIGRITGLDPTGLDFDKDDAMVQLSPRSADFVDVIYTNMKETGTTLRRGAIRFYPNGGAHQPENNTMYQSHYKSVHYFIESIVTPKVFLAYQANNWEDYLAGKRGDFEYMGEGVSRRKYGAYFLKTNAYPPYGQNEEESVNGTVSMPPSVPESSKLFPSDLDQLPW